MIVSGRGKQELIKYGGGKSFEVGSEFKSKRMNKGMNIYVLGETQGSCRMRALLSCL